MLGRENGKGELREERGYDEGNEPYYIRERKEMRVRRCVACYGNVLKGWMGRLNVNVDCEGIRGISLLVFFLFVFKIV